LVRDGDTTTTRPAAAWSGIDVNNSTFEPVARRYEGRIAVTAPAGKYLAKFTFDVGLVFANGLNPSLNSFGSRPTPQPGCMVLSVAVPIGIPSPQAYNANGARLVADARYGAAYAGGVSVARADAMCFSDATLFVANLRYQRLPVTYFFSPTITVDGVSIVGTPNSLAQGTLTPFETQVQFVTPALVPQSAFANIELSTDLNGVR
jgi:hypothetical protein